MSYIYSNWIREEEPYALPDIEVWEEDDGWYWQPCTPGCLPEGDPSGPFPSRRVAIEDMVSIYGDDTTPIEQE
jgi:hypothetical protein